jgi:hypothetical protein
MSNKHESENQNENQNDKSKNSPNRRVKNPLDEAEFFGKQYNTNAELPDPSKNLALLAMGVVEVIAGTRGVEQLARFLNEDVYQKLAARAQQAKEERLRNGKPARYPKFYVKNMRNQSPRDGVIESVVLLDSPKRLRAVAIRLEGFNNRWRATSVSVL